MAAFKAIIFDLGNTLLHFDGQWPDVLMQSDRSLLAALREQGLDLDTDRFLAEFRTRLNEYYIQRDSEFIEHTTAYVLQNLLEEWGHTPLSEDRLISALREMYAVSQSHWHVEDDAAATLQALRDAGYALGIISNAADDADVQLLVDKANIRSYFDFVLSSAACGIRKPNPRIFEIALTNWKHVQPHEAVMVGANTPGNRDHLDTIQPDATIDTLAELPPLLNSLNGAA